MTEQPYSQTSFQQDPFFKEIFKDKDFITSLLTELLDFPSLSRLDFSKMDLMSSNFVVKSLAGHPLRQLYNDLLWRIEWQDGNYSFLCVLLEMQSKVDLTMPKRIADYILGLYSSLETQGKIFQGRKTYPFVLPVVIYNGNRNWNAPLDLGELIADVPADLAPLRMRVLYKLVDLKHLKPKGQSLGQGLASWLVRLLNARSTADFELTIKALQELLKGDGKRRLRKLISALIMSFNQKTPLDPSIIDKLDEHQELDNIAEVAMSWVEEWKARVERGDRAQIRLDRIKARAEGRAEGEARGKAEGIAEGEAKGILNTTFNALQNLLKIRYGTWPDDVDSYINERKQDLPFVQRAYNLVVACPHLDDFIKGLKGTDSSISSSHA